MRAVSVLNPDCGTLCAAFDCDTFQMARYTCILALNLKQFSLVWKQKFIRSMLGLFIILVRSMLDPNGYRISDSTLGQLSWHP